jgi:hypothetical protein
MARSLPKDWCGGGERQPGAHVFAQRGDHRTEHERDKEQKANREYDREGKKTVSHEREKRAVRLNRDAPCVYNTNEAGLRPGEMYCQSGEGCVKETPDAPPR